MANIREKPSGALKRVRGKNCFKICPSNLFLAMSALWRNHLTRA
jgi:hypothetical protein